MTEPEQHANSPDSSVRPAPEYAWDVTKFEISVNDIWLQHIHLELAEAFGLVPSTNMVPSIEGTAMSAAEESFTAMVRWSCDQILAAPAQLAGTVGLRFKHKSGLPAAGVSYYCRVNAPILAYPYIRQIISHLTAGTRTGPLVIRPLDVPQFVRDTGAHWLADFTESVKKQDQDKQRGKNGSAEQNGPQL